MSSQDNNEELGEKRWAAEPVYEFDDPMYGGPDPQGERVYTITQAVDRLHKAL